MTGTCWRSPTGRGPDSPCPTCCSGRYLLQRLPAHSLAPVFRTGEPADGAFPLFREFCLSAAAQIGVILKTRRTQTNEVGRCALWLPALSVVCAAADRPVALVEIGASVGLNLLFDRYRYDYDSGVVLGAPDAPVSLFCESQGDRLPQLGMPAVAMRRGIELNPIDARNEDDRRWLLALVWPGNAQREKRLAAALAVAATDPPDVRAGDALAALPDVAGNIDMILVVLHSFVLYQFTLEQRVDLDAILHALAKRRPVTRIALESSASGNADLKLHTYTADGRRSRALATADPHGRWLRWTG